MIELAQGVHSVNRASYDEIEAANFSTIKHLVRSPAHYRHALTALGKDTDPRQRGRAVSMALFESDRFNKECVIWKGKVRSGKKWDKFSWENCDKEILTTGMHAKATGIAAAVRNCEMARPFLTGGRGEQTIVWTHRSPPLGATPGYDIKCKGRVDYLTPEWCIDLKNTDAEPDAFSRSCANYLAHVQAAFYLDGLFAATGVQRRYALIAVEPEPPHVVQVYVVEPEELELGRGVYRGWLDTLNHCRTTDSWPGYATAPIALRLPKWMLPKETEFLEEGGA